MCRPPRRARARLAAAMMSTVSLLILPTDATATTMPATAVVSASPLKPFNMTAVVRYEFGPHAAVTSVGDGLYIRGSLRASSRRAAPRLPQGGLSPRPHAPRARARTKLVRPGVLQTRLTNHSRANAGSLSRHPCQLSRRLVSTAGERDGLCDRLH